MTFRTREWITDGLFVTIFLVSFAARKKYIESRVQVLDQHSFTIIDSYPKALETAKEKRDVQKRSLPFTFKLHRIYFWLGSVNTISIIFFSKYNIADGMRQMFDPFERVARAHHVCPCCERPFSAEEEDEFVKKVDIHC